MSFIRRDEAIDTLTELYKNSSGDSHVAYRTALDTIYNLEYTENNNELNNILDDYGFPDESALRFALENYMRVITELSHGNLSKYNYTADFLISTFKDKLTVNDAFKDTDEVPEDGRSIIFIVNHRSIPCSGYYDFSSSTFVDVEHNKTYDAWEVRQWIYS
jgi:hypothetical protein